MATPVKHYTPTPFCLYDYVLLAHQARPKLFTVHGLYEVLVCLLISSASVSRARIGVLVATRHRKKRDWCWSDREAIRMSKGPVTMQTQNVRTYADHQLSRGAWDRTWKSGWTVPGRARKSHLLNVAFNSWLAVSEKRNVNAPLVLTTRYRLFPLHRRYSAFPASLEPIGLPYMYYLYVNRRYRLSTR